MTSNKINGEVKAVIDKFLNENIYPKIIDKDNLLGILVYGSTLTGFSSKNSDIDLLVILREADNTKRGVKYVNGKKIEYFIKPIEKFLSEGVFFTNRNCPSHVALEQNAYLYYDKGDLISNFLNADKTFYNSNRQIPKDNFDLKYVQIENRIASLKNILERNGEEFYMVYFNILEMIRTFHSKIHDEAEVPFTKAYRIYNDKNYYNKFVAADASNPSPDNNFVKLYNNCIRLTDKISMLTNLENLYKYEQQFISINPNDYEIDI